MQWGQLHDLWKYWLSRSWLTECHLSDVKQPGTNLLVDGEKRHWDPARIRTWVLWILVRCSYQLSHWSSGIGADDRWYLSIDTTRTLGWISQSVGLTLQYWVPKYVSAAPSELGISRHLACAVGTPQGLTGTISSSSTYTWYVCMAHRLRSPIWEVLLIGIQLIVQPENCSFYPLQLCSGQSPRCRRSD